MSARLVRWLAVFLLFLASAPAGAITCTAITSSGVSFTYYSKSNATTQGTFTVTCNRTSGEAATSVTYTVFADNGLTPTRKGGNQASLGNSKIAYDLYRDSACTLLWDPTNGMTGTISWQGNKAGNQTLQSSFWVCAPSSTVTGAGGTYLDTVTMSLTYPGGTTITNTFGVSIFGPANCTITTSPTSITLTYVPFGPAVSGITSFGVQCTDGMPYTMAPNVPNGVLTGVAYSLSLSSTAVTGNGVAQSHTVTATAPGGQAGQCSTPTIACTASQTHTIVISY